MATYYSVEQTLRFEDVLLDSRVLQAWVSSVETIMSGTSSGHNYDDCRILVTETGGILLMVDTSVGQMHSLYVEPEHWDYRHVSS